MFSSFFSTRTYILFFSFLSFSLSYAVLLVRCSLCSPVKMMMKKPLPCIFELNFIQLQSELNVFYNSNFLLSFCHAIKLSDSNQMREKQKKRNDKNKITGPMADCIIFVNRSSNEQRALSLMSEREWVNNCMCVCMTFITSTDLIKIVPCRLWISRLNSHWKFTTNFTRKQTRNIQIQKKNEKKKTRRR